MDITAVATFASNPGSAGAALVTAAWPSTLADRARNFAAHSKSANTRRAYSADWRDFTGWCAGYGRDPLPATPATVELYLTDLAGRSKVSTLTRRLAAISQAHQLAGFSSPTRESPVRLVMAGIRRLKGTAAAGKRPLLTGDLRQLVTALPATAQGRRDRALLLLGFAGGFRRSELAGLDDTDIDFREEGLVVTLRRSKTDQEGEGRQIGVPFGSHPAAPDARDRLTRDLPQGIALRPGEVRIQFQGAEDLAAKLFELSQAMANDWVAFSRIVA